MYGNTYDQPATTRVPHGETDYLAKAAELLAKAAEKNEQSNARYNTDLIAGRERIAGKYAQLAAIQRGQMPAELARVMFEQFTKDR